MQLLPESGWEAVPKRRTVILAVVGVILTIIVGGVYAAFTLNISGTQVVTITPSVTIASCDVNGIPACSITGGGQSATLTLGTLVAAGQTSLITITIANSGAASMLTINPQSSNTGVATITGPTSQGLGSSTGGQQLTSLTYTITAVANGSTNITIGISG